jgi:hypothetical protein
MRSDFHLIWWIIKLSFPVRVCTECFPPHRFVYVLILRLGFACTVLTIHFLPPSYNETFLSNRSILPLLVYQDFVYIV